MLALWGEYCLKESVKIQRQGSGSLLPPFYQFTCFPSLSLVYEKVTSGSLCSKANFELLTFLNLPPKCWMAGV